MDRLTFDKKCIYVTSADEVDFLKKEQGEKEIFGERVVKTYSQTTPTAKTESRHGVDKASCLFGASFFTLAVGSVMFLMTLSGDTSLGAALFTVFITSLICFSLAFVNIKYGTNDGYGL